MLTIIFKPPKPLTIVLYINVCVRLTTLCCGVSADDALTQHNVYYKYSKCKARARASDFTLVESLLK